MSILPIAPMRRTRLVAIAVLLLLGCLNAWSGTPTIWPAEPGIRTDPALGGRLKLRLMPGIDRETHRSVLKALGLQPRYVIVPWERSVTRSMGKGADQLLTVRGDLPAILRAEEPLLRTWVVEYDAPVPPEKMASLLRTGCSQIEVCEPVYLDRILAEPNDSLVSEQAMLSTIRAFDGWDLQPGSSQVVIGISDSGVLQEHEDLKDQLHARSGEIPDNGIDDDGNGYIDDHLGYNFCTADDGTPPGNTYNKTEGHGTGVAGICGATANNQVGIAGVAGQCRLFPLKTMPDNIPGIVYGYESLVYCAMNGIQVVNCSWGSGSRSCINESMVAYAVARNVAIVAAAGNHGTSAPFYPASYTDVLSVGVTDPDDNVIGMTGHGPTVDIMAPGQRTTTTSNDGTYGGFCCTSGSSPIVAGVVGLVLSERAADGSPRYSALEACAIVKERAARVDWPFVPGNVDPRLLPTGRVDVVRALTPDADQVSIEVTQITATSTANDTRWAAGDTVRVSVQARNVLHPFVATALDVVDLITPVLDQGLGIDIPQRFPIGDTGIMVDRNAVLDLPPLQALVLRDSDTTEFLATQLQVRRSSGLLNVIPVNIPITPAPAFRTLSNEVLTLSVGDRGRIGNTDLQRAQGAGVTYKEFCGQLYEGGLMVAGNWRLVDAVRAERGINDHFRPSKRFTRPEPLTGIVTDADAPDSLRIGVSVTQQVRLASADSGVFVVDVTVRNITDHTLYELAVGWFYDWDVGTQPVANHTVLHRSNSGTAVQRVESTIAGEPVVLVASMSLEGDAVPTSAGMDNTTTYGGFPMQAKQAILGSGTRIQYDEQNDVAVVSGMRFTRDLAPGEERRFRHVIVIDTDLARADALVAAQEQDLRAGSTEALGVIYPNPAATYARVTVRPASGNVISVYDLQGREVYRNEDAAGTVGTLTLDCSAYAPGIYQVRLVTNTGEVHTAGLVVVR